MKGQHELHAGATQVTFAGNRKEHGSPRIDGVGSVAKARQTLPLGFRIFNRAAGPFSNWNRLRPGEVYTLGN